MILTIDLPQTLKELSPLVSAIGVILIAYWQYKAKKFAVHSHDKAQCQRAENNTQLRKIHRLVNGSHTAVLKQNAATARRLAMMTGNKKDAQLARDAERILEEHMIAAAKAEEQEGKERQAPGNLNDLATTYEQNSKPMKGKNMIKKLKRNMAILMTFIAALTMPIGTGALVGCTNGCSTVAEGHDAIVVRAEQAADISFEVFDAFLRLEETNRDYLRTVSPDIERTANRIRVDGRAAIENLRSTTRAYKQNRTPENKANVDTWMKTVEELRRIALKYIGTAKGG